MVANAPRWQRFCIDRSHGHDPRHGASTLGAKSAAHRGHFDGGGRLWLGLHVDENATHAGIDHDAARGRQATCHRDPENWQFQPEIDNNTGQIMVPADKYQEARMLLASKGLPRTEVQGMDTLKDMPAMTTSQFMEQVRYNNAMEQELAKTISQIAGIRSARVHLAAPKQSVFVRDRVPTKASVIITRAPGKASVFCQCASHHFFGGFQRSLLST
jgi:hypothetical protein